MLSSSYTLGSSLQVLLWTPHGPRTPFPSPCYSQEPGTLDTQCLSHCVSCLTALCFFLCQRDEPRQGLRRNPVQGQGCDSVPCLPSMPPALGSFSYL